jgi:ketosteroid isomerase-like protein
MSISPESVARAFVWAINAHDVHAIVELMCAEHVFIDSLGNVIRGRETMRGGWENYFRMVPDYTLTIEETCSLEDVVIMLGAAHGTYTTDGSLLPENAWKTPAALRALIEGGKVKEWRVYADNEPIRQLMSKNRAKQ